jgi:CheY-like chemotaxis protein
MSKTLLLADDSVTIQKVVGISFASEDVRLVTVDNGDDAIARAREIRPDLVLADVVMPGRNGYEVCAAIKADPELRHIPVILLTGTFEAFDEERAQQVGAATHVAKPFEAQTLVAQVKRLLAAPPPPPARPAATAPPARPAATAPAARAPAVPLSMDPQDETFEAEPGEEDSFDFFDDDLAGMSTPSRRPSDTAPPNSLDLDLDGDAVFAFGEDAAEERPAPRRGAPSPLASARLGTPGDRTVAILPEEEESLDSVEPAELLVDAPSDTGIGASDLAAFEAPPRRHAPVEPRPRPAAGPRHRPDDFDFDLGSGSERGALLDTTHLTQDAVVDPKGVSGFTISSSDLGDTLSGGPRPSLRGAAAPTAAPERPPARQTGVDLAETRPRVAPLPPLEAEPIDDAEPLDEPASLGEPADEPALDARRAPDADAALRALVPQLREQLHDTLERIAWDSFSDVTEKIVRQAVERVEQIAWEVIPHMAEALVREEIRRMKGEK